MKISPFMSGFVSYFSGAETFIKGGAESKGESEFHSGVSEMSVKKERNTC